MKEKKNLLKNNNAPIGIFDSGFGGLTVMSAMAKVLRNENFIYFGDTAHVPYGSKSKSAVITFSKNIADFLLSKNIKMLVIACNTASAFALETLQKSLKIPVIGVIEPGAKAAVENAENGSIGIIGTEGTVNSASYKNAIHKISKLKVFQKACPLLVPIIEEGWVNTKVANDIVKIYLKKLLDKNIKVLVLGCTHYPLLKKILQKNIGKNIKLIDSAFAVASAVKKLLNDKNLNAKKKNNRTIKFYVSDNPKKFICIGKKFFGGKINTAKKITLE